MSVRGMPDVPTESESLTKPHHPPCSVKAVFGGTGASSGIANCLDKGVRRPVTCHIFRCDLAIQAKGRTRTEKTMATKQTDGGATTGYEAELWAMADALRSLMDAAEYKHVVLGLIFLKSISARLRRASRGGAGQVGRRRGRGSRRVHRGEHLLGSEGGPMGAPEGRGAAADHRPDRGPGHDRDRARQPGAQGGAAQGLRAARLGRATTRPTNRHDRKHPRRGRRSALPGRARPRLRVLPLDSSRVPRRQEGRRVLHPALRRQAARRDARALPWAGLRSLLRIFGHVRAVGRVHSRPPPAETETPARRAATSRSTARSRTIRRGGSRR